MDAKKLGWIPTDRMEGEKNHFRNGVLVSLILHLLAVLFVFALGVGKSGTVRMERSIEVSLQTYEPRTDEKRSRAEKKKRARPPEKKKAPAKPPVKAKAQEKKKPVPAPPEKKPKVAEKPPAVKKTAPKKERKIVKKPAPAEKPPEKKAVPEPPEKKETAVAPEKPEPPKEKEIPAAADGKKEVIRDMRKESVIRRLKESPAAKTAPGEPEEPRAERPPVSQDEPESTVPRKKEPEGEADSEPAIESIRKNPEGAVAKRAPAETSPRVISLVLDVYYKAISGRIEENLILPINVEPRGFMTALVSFRMKQSGEVYDVEISESSGNDIFDSYCIKAVNASSPLPVPPSELRGRIRSEPFVVPCKNRK